MSSSTGLPHQERCRCFGHKVPLYAWFVLSGALCDVAQALIDLGVFYIYPYEWERATVCWTVSYTLSVVIRHFSHRILVFGEPDGTYCQSLGRTYLTYSSSIIISIMTNHVLIDVFQCSHKMAWILTMLWTGVYNYFALKSSWRSSGSNTKSTPTASSSVNSSVGAAVHV
jgi:putative flippase GtrA